MSIQLPTFFAERFVSGALPKVFGLDVIAGVALRVVMVDTLLDRVPRTFSHRGTYLFLLK